MRQATLKPADLVGVFAVPPVARRNNASQTIDFAQNQRIVEHISAGGISRLIYGGNAFLYHFGLSEFEALLEWLSDLSGELQVIPSIGPSYGRAMEQAALLRKHNFSCAMVLPCGDPRDAGGLERGYRNIAEVAQARLIVYLKDENTFGSCQNDGLDALARLVQHDICAGIKYAVVRENPSQDAYLEALLARVDRNYVISGIGERPAVVHLRDWHLPGFTTGSGCIAPRLSQQLFEACQSEDFSSASQIQLRFLPLEDLRDAWGPSRVLHHATEIAGIARTGPMVPYVSALSEEQLAKLAPVAKALMSDKL